MASATTDLTIIAKFDRRVSALGLASGDVLSDQGTVGRVLISHDIVEIPITGIPHDARVNLSFPGLTDWEFPTPVNTTDAAFCVVVESGDYDGDGQTTDEATAAHLADCSAGGDQTLSFTYDANGNLETRVDEAADLTDIYLYDADMIPQNEV